MGKSAVCRMYKTVGRSEIRLFVLNKLVTLTDRAKLRLYSQLIAQDKRIKLNRWKISKRKNRLGSYRRTLTQKRWSTYPTCSRQICRARQSWRLEATSFQPTCQTYRMKKREKNECDFFLGKEEIKGIYICLEGKNFPVEILGCPIYRHHLHPSIDSRK